MKHKSSKKEEKGDADIWSFLDDKFSNIKSTQQCA